MIDNIDDYVTNINDIREHEFDADVVAFMREVEERGEWDNPTYQAYATQLDRHISRVTQMHRIIRLVQWGRPSIIISREIMSL